jgi:hypothetical protein
MNVKGTVYVTTKATVIEAFGEERWNKFMARLAEKDKYFKENIIMSITLIPLDKIIVLFDELIDECFNGDKNASYVLFGMIGGKWTLSPGGPYHSYLLTKDLKLFAETVLPKLWTTLFDGGLATARLENNVVYVKVIGFPIKHVYFEKFLMASFKQALKIFGKKSNATMVKSLTAGDDHIYFKYELRDA